MAYRLQQAICYFFMQYFQNTQGLLFVVDSNDRERIDEARDVLQGMMAEGELRDAILIVFANKQDPKGHGSG
ncbi:hypothetical protein Pelo_11279 [Pelomyxa schiedti]|nr:hypothetical protein Pelo_11279 [Pelomyxa schiedti]